MIEYPTDEIPLLTTKKVFWKSAIKEILWMWVDKSNIVADLDSNIWKEWQLPDETIGNSYGYKLGQKVYDTPKHKKIKKIMESDLPNKEKVLLIGEEVNYDFTKSNVFSMVEKVGYSHDLMLDIGNSALESIPKFDQVENLIYELKHNPESRRHITLMFSPEDVDKASLFPCAFGTLWSVKNGRLNLLLLQRSVDLGLGWSFNTFGYYILLRMVAQVCGYKVGTFKHMLGDYHIYERHIPAIKKQIEHKGFKAPKLWINPEVKNIEDFKIEDFKIENYECGKYTKLEVAI